MVTEKQVLEALSQVMDPEIHRSLTELNMVRNVQINETGDVSLLIALTIPGCPLKERIRVDVTNALKKIDGVGDVCIEFGSMTAEERAKILPGSQRPLPKLNAFNKVKHVVAVMSGKGGVGKSSITALLAVSLTRMGKKVGILDADITGPSIPRLFGVPAGGLRGGDQGILPSVTNLGIKLMSTNLLLEDENKPVVWRGPMIAGVIQQFWNDTLWGMLDILLVDMPPGTSDAALTVAQSLPLDGVLLVTTPQQLSTMVVMKALGMLQVLKTPLLGVVENMSSYVCPDCHTAHAIFGSSHAATIARSAESEVLAQLPIRSEITELLDSGKSEQAHMDEIDALAVRMLEKLEKTEKVKA